MDLDAAGAAMKVGRISFSAGLTPDEIQQRSIERLNRLSPPKDVVKHCAPRLHWIDDGAERCACGKLTRTPPEPH